MNEYDSHGLPFAARPGKHDSVFAWPDPIMAREIPADGWLGTWRRPLYSPDISLS